MPPSTKGGSGMNSPEQMVEALTDMLSKLIVGGGKSQADFDLDAFTARVMKKDQYRAAVHVDRDRKCFLIQGDHGGMALYV